MTRAPWRKDTKRAADNYAALPNHANDNLVKRYQNGSVDMIGLRSRDQGIKWWDHKGHLAAWKTGCGYSANGGPTPRWDALCSYKTTPTQRAQTAWPSRRSGEKNVDPKEVHEPKNWLQTRDGFERPDFRLPAGN